MIRLLMSSHMYTQVCLNEMKWSAHNSFCIRSFIRFKSTILRSNLLMFQIIGLIRSIGSIKWFQLPIINITRSYRNMSYFLSITSLTYIALMRIDETQIEKHTHGSFKTFRVKFASFRFWIFRPKQFYYYVELRREYQPYIIVV